MHGAQTQRNVIRIAYCFDIPFQRPDFGRQLVHMCLQRWNVLRFQNLRRINDRLQLQQIGLPFLLLLDLVTQIGRLSWQRFDFSFQLKKSSS